MDSALLYPSFTLGSWDPLRKDLVIDRDRSGWVSQETALKAERVTSANSITLRASDKLLKPEYALYVFVSGGILRLVY